MAADNSSLSDMNHSVLVLDDPFNSSLEPDKQKFDSSGIGFLENSKPRNNEDTKKIAVCIRKKPVINDTDTIKIDQKCLSVSSSRVSYNLSNTKSSHKFCFDSIYNENFTNMEIFNRDIKKLADHALAGGSSSIIAYGQTNSGKTYTILNQYTGILFEAIKYVLNHETSGTVSFCEIYMGKCYDCLNDRQEFNLYEKNDEIYASCMVQEAFTDFTAIKNIFEKGVSNRISGSTDSNKSSSRSHAIIIIELCSSGTDTKKVVFKKLASRNSIIFVDLAGSEKGSDRRTCSKKTVSEGSEINKSLLAMKECIRGFECNSSYLPFRLSKLTQVLKNSLLGDAMTCVIATISAEQKDIEQTLNTLRYMHRIKEANIGVLGSKDEKNVAKVKLCSVTENIDRNPMASSHASETQHSQINKDCIDDTPSDLETSSYSEQKRARLESMPNSPDRKLRPMTILNLDLIEDRSRPSQSHNKNASVILKTKPFRNPGAGRLSHNFPATDVFRGSYSDHSSSNSVQKNFNPTKPHETSGKCTDVGNRNVQNTNKSKDHTPKQDISDIRESPLFSNNSPFDSFVPRKSCIEPYTLKFQRNKIYSVLDEISEMARDETNLNNLKMIFLELINMKHSMNKL